MSVVCCQVEVSVTGRSVVQRSRAGCMCLSVTEEPYRGGLRPLGLSSHEKKKLDQGGSQLDELPESHFRRQIKQQTY